MNQQAVEQTILQAVSARRGHFVYESGHHGDLWLELDSLFVDAPRMQQWAAALANQAATCRPQFVCGPLTGGAFVAQLLAAELGAKFVFAEREVAADGQVQYHIPHTLRPLLVDQPVLLVDDAVNAGSALRATAAELQACRAQLVGFAALLVLGAAASQMAGQYGVPFFALAALQRGMWTAENCPLCQTGEVAISC